MHQLVTRAVQRCDVWNLRTCYIAWRCQSLQTTAPYAISAETWLCLRIPDVDWSIAASLHVTASMHHHVCLSASRQIVSSLCRVGRRVYFRFDGWRHVFTWWACDCVSLSIIMSPGETYLYRHTDTATRCRIERCLSLSLCVCLSLSLPLTCSQTICRPPTCAWRTRPHAQSNPQHGIQFAAKWVNWRR